MDKRVLDPCCGSRMFWFDRENPDVVFGDIREFSGTLCDGRALEVAPDQHIDFTEIPYPDGSFKLVVFDPPHLENLGARSWMAAKYGVLPKQWHGMIAAGFAECFRVLAEDGVLVFKWNESRIKVREVLDLATVQPLFGHTTGQNGKTHWCVFMKPRAIQTACDCSCGCTLMTQNTRCLMCSNELHHDAALTDTARTVRA